jgi:hypothetical protein
MNRRKGSMVLLMAAMAVGFVNVADARLAANRLAANRLAANRLAANGLAQAGDGAVNDVLAIELPGGALFTR